MKLKKIIYATFFLLSLMILIGLYLLVNVDNQFDNEYAMITFSKDIETREYNFDKFNSVYFFNNRDPITEFTKKTIFIKEIPNLKIVNSEKYKVEIIVNSDALNKLSITTSDKSLFGEDNILVITFLDNCYKPVHLDDPSYDYDTGLYVEVSKLEITIYAPINNLRSDTSIKLNYDAPECEKMNINLADSNGIITNINADNFELYCSGSSKITLSGKVNENSKIMIFHNTKIDAKKLLVNKKNISVSSALLPNFSYVKCDNAIYFEETSSFFLIKIILYFSPLVWLILLVCQLCKKNKILNKSR